MLLMVHEHGRGERRFVRLVPSAQIALDTARADLAMGGDRVEVLPDGRYRVTAHAREEGTGVPATLTLTVKKTPVEYEVTLSAAGIPMGDPLSGYAEFAITPTAFNYVEPGRYFYDIWLTRNGEEIGRAHV